MNLTPGKLKAMQEYAKILVLRNPRITEKSLRLQVCRKFKVSVKNETTGASNTK